MKRMFLKSITTCALIIPALCLGDEMQSYKGEIMPINWTGFYVGGNLGWKWAEFDSEIETADFTFSRSRVHVRPIDFNTDTDSSTGGGQIGFNYQIRQFVLGLEADWNGMDFDNDQFVWANTNNFVYVPDDSFSLESEWQSSVRARLGYVYNNWLFYVTGGAAFINVEVSANFIQTVSGGITFPPAAGSDTETITGWTAGLGAEYALTNHVSVGLEYRYSGYGEEDFDLGQLDVAANSSTSFIYSPVTAELESISTNELLAKINFRFG